MRLQYNLILLVLLVSLLGYQHAESAKILAIFSYPGRSQYIFAESYLKALAGRGHEVTVINTFDTTEEVKNFRIIAAPKIHEYYSGFNVEFNANANQWKMLNVKTKFINFLTQNIFEEPEVQKLLQSDENFDLLLAECVHNEALFGFAQHFRALTIGFSSYGADRRIDELVGTISPISYNPYLLSSRSDRMDYWERLINLWDETLGWLHDRLVHMPTQEELYRKYFPNANVSLSQTLRSFSLILLGQHFTLSFPRPYLPNMIEIGGLHLVQKSKPLPHDIEQFINESEHGVIYFSLGSNVKSKDLPIKTRCMLLSVFGRLKQRVLWKFEDDQFPGKPANVFIQKWFPQTDILAHPNVMLFVTQGGLLSIIEAIHYGKPILGLPVFWDQFLNLERAKKAGYGLSIHLTKLTEQSLTEKLNKVLHDKSFTQVAKKMSLLYRDQPEPALERAIWWTEYVLRHKGAPHMRAAAMHLSFIQLHSLDTIATLFGGAAFAVALLTFLMHKFVVNVIKRTCRLDKLKKQ